MTSQSSSFKRNSGRKSSDPSGVRRSRLERVRELERDPEFVAAIREGLASERLGKGVRFKDLKRRNA